MKKLMISPGIVIANALVIGLAALSYLSLYYIQPLFPLNGVVTDDRTPTFAWSGQGTSFELLIDDEPGFSSPMIFDVKGNRYSMGQELDFGTYWWKVRVQGAESRAMRFDLVSTVALSRPDPGMISNTGNTALLVHRGGLSAITGAVTLGVNQTLDIGDGEDVKAEQK
ncbi:MAG: hypothetical protein JXC85_02610 [Candidatus Aenigmarchaeota archaeon]|nr:hypothetical protein [Candidatus Aenigmarchaeota archaeon]